MPLSPHAFTQHISAAYKALNVARSGLFDARLYCQANPDVPTSPKRALWHFIRHANAERRPANQPPLTTWLLPKILAGSISSKQARTAQNALKLASDRATQERALAALPCNSHGYFYHVALADHRFSEAYDLIDQLPDDERLLARHYFAVRHVKLDELDAALNDALARLSTNDVSVNELIAIRDFYEVSGCQRLSRQTFYQTLLKAMLAACKRENRAPYQPLWWAGLPCVRANSAQDVRTLSNTPRNLKLSPPPPKAQKFTDLLSLSTSNALNEVQHWLCTKTGKIVPAKLDTKNTCLTLWLLTETQWRQAETDPLQSSNIEAFESLVKKAAEHFAYIAPVTATGIFDLRKSGYDQSPFIGYHTITNSDQRALNFKESALPGYYLFDSGGYSGWATTPDLSSPTKALSNTITLTDLQEQFVKKRVTKYQQASNSHPLPDDFVFIALQVPDDTVASLSYIDRETVIRTVAEYYSISNHPVLIKAHPKDTSLKTKNLLKKLSKTYKNLAITTAPIHDIIPASRLVIVANSGVGFEALLHQKPVVTTAKSDYAPCTKVANTTNALITALEQHAQTTRGEPISKDAIRFLENYVSYRTFQSSRLPEAITHNFNRMKR